MSDMIKNDEGKLYTQKQEDTLEKTRVFRTSALDHLIEKGVKNLDPKEIRLGLALSDSLDESTHKYAENKVKHDKVESDENDKATIAALLTTIDNKLGKHGGGDVNIILSDNYVPTDENIVEGEISDITRIKDDLDSIIANGEKEQE